MGISIITSLISDVFGNGQGNAIVAGMIGFRGDTRSRYVSKRHAVKSAGHTTLTRCCATAAARLWHWLVPMQAPVRAVVVPRVSVGRAS